LNNEIIVLYNNATKYLEKLNYKKALPMFKQVIREYPCKEAYTNLGNCHRGLGQDKEMFKCYEMALRDDMPFLDPTSQTHLHAMNNLGLAHYMYGDDEKAIHYYTKAIKIKKDFWEAWWNCSTAKLRMASSGKIDMFPEGWEMYKARFLKGGAIKLKNDREDLVFWDTISGGKSILVLTEQGIGDSIMFGRYLSELAKKFDKVYVQCDASLDWIFKDYECVRHASECDAEVAYPICSLGECFPLLDSKWISSDEKFDFGPGLNVGIVWDGSPTHANNRYRSVPIGYFNNLSRHCNLYSLSPGFKGNKYVKSLPITSWADTAKYVSGLDLVIGVDTSVMHLVGSMGCEGWLLQPYKETDFRWGNGVSRSVWYDTIEVFENKQNWGELFSRVEERLSVR
jgi:hypothetical protein